MSAKRLLMEQWKAWRDDYRCARPPVSCKGCDTYYPTDKDAAVMIFDGFTLVECSNCYRKQEIRRAKAQALAKLQRHINARRNGNRKVNSDVACRYITRFGGSTFAIQTEMDNCEVYLQNAGGKVLARVDMFDKYPKPVITTGLLGLITPTSPVL